MDDVWFGQGATHADFEACLKALALQDKQRPPLLAVASGGETPRLLLASRALFSLFGVSTGEALSARLLGGHDPGARRLGTLCQGLALEGAPRLERLRFFMGPGTEIITFLCRRIPIDGAPRFIAAALGVRPGLMPEHIPAMPAAPPETPAIERPAILAPHVEVPRQELPRQEAPRHEAPKDRAASDHAPSDPARRVDPRSVAGRPIAALEASPVPAPPVPAPPVSVSSPAQMPLDAPMGIQAIQATLRRRWPASRTARFLWQCDADMTCTQVSPPLADIVGAANADIVGRDMLALAAQIDPTGRLAAALSSKETWSGLNVDWPIANAPAAVSVGLGAIPALDRDKIFEGYRGYGVIHLDKIVGREMLRLDPIRPREVEPAPTANVVRFPDAKALSAEDQAAFVTLGAELREEAGLEEFGLHPLEPIAQPPAPVAAVSSEAAAGLSAVSDDKRAEDIARHGLSILDRLAVGLLVSRDNVPIFANRHLLDSLGFADEDALHEAGGTTHLFGGQPGNVTGSEAVGLRTRDGRIIPTHARMQTIDWDGLPAILLTLQEASPSNPSAPPQTPPVAEIAEPETAAPPTSVSNDDTAHDAAEARELRAILETATDGVAVIDADGNVTSLNRSGEALFGCDRGTVIGKPFLSLFAAHNQGLAADYLDGLKSNATKRLLNDGREFLVNTHRGATIPVFMTLGRLGPSTISDAEEAPGGARFCALFRDLTHWKKVERDLEAAKLEAERGNARKTDFLAKVSHEIRTPLNAIIGFADVMMEERFGPVGNARYKDYLRDIHTSGTHVMSLVNDLLDLSKIEAGKLDLAVDAIDANKVIGECVAIMQPQASRARVIMRLSLAPALPQIKADERSLRQIVLNLLSNAVKFNEPGGQVIVATATPETGHVVIRIRDTGPGMSEADIAAALEPFRQLPPGRALVGEPSSGMPGGTGLGLPLTKALVEANQASFSIRSKVDHGTLVEVAFPPARVLAR